MNSKYSVLDKKSSGAKTNLRLQLFDGYDEIINIAIPLIFMVGAAAELVFKKFPLASLQVNFITKILMLDSLHLVLTYILLLNLPELKDWLLIKTNGNPSKLWFALIGIGFSVFVLLSLPLLNAFSSFVFQKYLYNLIVIFGAIIPAFHGLYQVKGLMLGYNQKIRTTFNFSENELTLSRTLEQDEKMGIDLFFSVQFFLAVITFLDFNLLGLQISVSNQNSLKLFTVLLSCMLALYIGWKSWRFPYARRSFQGLYLLRLFLYPLAFFSKTALAALVGLHGVEYFFVYKQMLRRSKVHQAAIKKIKTITILGLIISTILIYPEWGVLENEQKLWMKILVSAVTGFAYTHYWLDRIIFRMRDSQTRQFVGKLFP